MFIPNPKYSSEAGGVNPVEKHRYIQTIALNERAIDRYDMINMIDICVFI